MAIAGQGLQHFAQRPVIYREQATGPGSRVATADRLRRLCFPLAELTVRFPILNREFPNLGVDMAMNAAYSNCASYVSFPALAVTRNELATSTIQGPPLRT